MANSPCFAYSYAFCRCAPPFHTFVWDLRPTLGASLRFATGRAFALRVEPRCASLAPFGLQSLTQTRYLLYSRGSAPIGRSPRGEPVLSQLSAYRQSPALAVPNATVANRRSHSRVRFAGRGTRSVLALRVALRMRLCVRP
ncbi:hypothetical protein Y036_5945 [Burkholderia pseudomallei]|uniref:Uncharacterized protein n=1 Tax=Burkholderia pseudomallei TaxID=28450 RepID=A0AA40JJE6_BURPE|nr:hypothetical protein Y036_5945 [Burkholderia pseudomallei]